MTYRTSRSTGGAGSLFGVLVILAVLYIPPLRHAADNVIAAGVRHFIESITPDPNPPAPPVTVGG